MNITTFRGAQETTMKTIHKNHTTTRRLQYIAACAGIVSCCPWFNRLGKKNNVDLNQPLSREVPPIQAPKRRHGVYQGAYFLNEKRSKSEILGGISGFNEILFCQTPNLHETNWIDYMKDDILSYAKYGLPT